MAALNQHIFDLVKSLAPSLILHICFFTLIGYLSADLIHPKAPEQVVHLKLVSMPPVETKPAESPPQQIKQKQLPTKAKATPKAKPIQGFNKDSLAKDGAGISVPVGNTLMAEDQGKRVTSAEGLSGDLSSRARLISFIKPTYTPEAIDQGIQGEFTIEVFIESDGTVSQAELKSPVGAGMDELLVKAALAAKFDPRREKDGTPQKGWDEIKVVLSIP